MTNSTLGPAPVVDFDGTLARLEVEWERLRARLHVDHIGDLWRSEDLSSWSIVTDAEIEAAGRAAPIAPVRTALELSSTFGVLTDNSEDAVERFLARFPKLGSRVAVVVGRETLSGPKRDYDVFRRGFAECVDATAAARGTGAVVFVGDADWELVFARRLGADAVDVRDLAARP